jgi:Phage integrase family
LPFEKTMVLHPKIQAYINNFEEEGTRKTFSSLLNTLQKYAVEEYKSVDAALNKIAKKKIDVYDFLIAFKNHRVNKEVSKRVKKTRINVAVNFLEWTLKIVISRNTLKNFCHWGINNDVNEKGILDRPTVIKILQNCDAPRLKAFLHLEAAIGSRPKEETCQLRIKDIVFDPKQPFIHFPAEISKTNTARDAFMTQELTEVMKRWLDYKFRERNRRLVDNNKKYQTAKYIPTRNDNDLLFSIHEKIKGKRSRSIYHNISNEFYRLVKSLGLEKRNDINRRLITLKSFRDFVKSQISDMGYEQFSEYHIGHKGSTYWQRNPKDKIKTFKAIEPALTYLNEDAIVAITQDLRTKTDAQREEINRLNQRLAEKDRETEQLHELEKRLNDYVLVDKLRHLRSFIIDNLKMFKEHDRLDEDDILKTLNEAIKVTTSRVDAAKGNQELVNQTKNELQEYQLWKKVIEEQRYDEWDEYKHGKLTLDFTNNQLNFKKVNPEIAIKGKHK